MHKLELTIASITVICMLLHQPTLLNALEAATVTAIGLLDKLFSVETLGETLSIIPD